MTRFTSVEVCAGAGGQALGLESAGFNHLACVEIDPHACATLRDNRPGWNVVSADIREWVPSNDLRGVTLLAAGVPCPPFSVAGKQLGRDDDRDLFPEMVRLACDLQPQAVMIENVRGLLNRKFDDYRHDILTQFEALGYSFCGWDLINSADYGVPQSRQRSILVMMRPEAVQHFAWPEPHGVMVTVGELLEPLMAEAGWEGAADWARKAQGIAPALVGGSMKHGGADLGPTRAKAAWRALGVDGVGIADTPPKPDFRGLPRLTVRMAAAIQGFPPDWQFAGRKTASYRQVGNAFPPPVAEALGNAVAVALTAVN